MEGHGQGGYRVFESNFVDPTPFSRFVRNDSKIHRLASVPIFQPRPNIRLFQSHLISNSLPNPGNVTRLGLGYDGLEAFWDLLYV